MEIPASALDVFSTYDPKVSYTEYHSPWLVRLHLLGWRCWSHTQKCWPVWWRRRWGFLGYRSSPPHGSTPRLHRCHGIQPEHKYKCRGSRSCNHRMLYSEDLPNRCKSLYSQGRTLACHQCFRNVPCFGIRQTCKDLAKKLGKTV